MNRYVWRTVLLAAALSFSACAESDPSHTTDLEGSSLYQEKNNAYDPADDKEADIMEMEIQIDHQTFTAVFADTQAARELQDILQVHPVTLDLQAYGEFEAVGPLPQSLSADDRQITAGPGDIMLYQSSQIVMFYGENTWSYTPLGKVTNTTEWSDALKHAHVQVVLRLKP